LKPKQAFEKFEVGIVERVYPERAPSPTTLTTASFLQVITLGPNRANFEDLFRHSKLSTTPRTRLCVLFPSLFNPTKLSLVRLSILNSIPNPVASTPKDFFFFFPLLFFPAKIFSVAFLFFLVKILLSPF
jgi:hypothetical protein